MANISGNGGAKGREMIATIRLPKDSKIKDGVHKMNAKAAQEEILGSDKNVMMNVQMNNIGKEPAQADPHPYLFTETVTRKDGSKGFNHGKFYSNKTREDGQPTQLQQILRHCDSYSVNNGYASFAIKGDVGIGKDDNGSYLYVKANTMQPSSQKVTADLNKEQFDATLAAAKYRKEMGKDTPSAVKEAEAQAENMGAEAEGAGYEQPEA